MNASTVAIAFYLAALIWVVWRGRAQAKAGDMFNIFGRKAELWRATAGYLSLIGAGELITISQLGYDNGLDLLWFPGGIAAGFILLGALADKVRTHAKLIGTNTLVGYVTRVFGQSSGLALSIIFLIALGALLTIQFIVGGQLLGATTGLSADITPFVLASVIVVYLLIGGYVAVLSTDILRLVFLSIVIVVISAATATKGISLVNVGGLLYSPMPLGDGITLFILGMFGALCAGDVWQTVLASASKTVLRHSMFLAAFAFLVFGLLIGSLGMAAKQLSPTLPEGMSALLAAAKFVIPASLAPLTALMIVGSIMATADTEIWVISSSLVSILKPAPDKDDSDEAFQSKVRTMVRFMIPIVAGIALLLGYFTGNAQSIYEGLLILLTAIAPAMIAILFDIRRPIAVALSLWAALGSFLCIAALYRLATPPVLTFLPAACSLIGLVIGLAIDRSRSLKL